MALGVLGAILVCLIGLTSIPVTSESALFVAVTSPDRFTDRVLGSRLQGRPNGEFAIHDGKLYLKVQGTRAALALVTFVSHYEWTIPKLRTLRAQHPELERFFPDPTKSNAGVTWIPNGSA